MAVGELFTTGLVVPDLERAIVDTVASLGVEFTPIQEAPLRLRTPNGLEEVSLRFVYSLGGAPHIELIQAVPGGYYDASGGGSIHHIGMWVDDLRKASATLDENGLPFEACGLADADDDGPTMFAFHTSGHGLRVELVDAAMQPTFQGWLTGGDLGL